MIRSLDTSNYLACEIDAMFYVYVLESVNDSGFYIGCTKDVKNRIKEHNSGHIEATKNRLPMKLVYYEASLDKSDAFRREKYLKTIYMADDISKTG